MSTPKTLLTGLLALLLAFTPAFSQAPAVDELTRLQHGAETGKADGKSSFVVYDAMKPQKNEDLAKYGLRPITVIYTSRMWPGPKEKRNIEELPEKQRIEEVAKSLPQETKPLCVFDIEHWPLDFRKTVRKDGDDILAGGQSEVKKSIEKMSAILGWAKAANPAASFGYYSCVPIRDYFTPQKSDPEKMQEWQAANDVLQPLADASDALFPSLYTFYPDQAGWVKYATGVLAEAKRIAKGKPVYAFVWPRYHTSNKEIGNQFIPGDYWRLQLRTIRAQGVQGVILWEGGNGGWDPEPDWWKETIGFMKEIGVYRDN